MSTIAPLPISSIGDSYSGLLPDALSTYPSDMPTFSGPAYNVTSTAASPSSSSTWQGIASLFNTIGTTTASILNNTGVTKPTPTTGQTVASNLTTGSSGTLLLIGLIAIGALLVMHMK